MYRLKNDDTHIICKVGGDVQSDQSQFQNAATMKRGVDDRTVFNACTVEDWKRILNI